VVLEKVMSDEAVQPGEKVVTSGGDQIFPKGLAVGTVTKVSPGAELFLNIRVKPAADLSRLEEVLVITQQLEKEPALLDGALPMRAAEILAQRLPSVPDRPPDNPNAPPPPTSGLKIYSGPASPGTAAGPKPAGAGATTHTQSMQTPSSTTASAKPHVDASVTPGSAASASKPDASGLVAKSPQKPHASAAPAANNATSTAYSQSQPSAKTAPQPKPPSSATPTQEPPQ
jgi:rod shape-determining protein MreC